MSKTVWIIVLVIAVLLLMGLIKNLLIKMITRIGKMGVWPKCILTVLLFVLAAYAFTQIFLEKKSDTFIPGEESEFVSMDSSAVTPYTKAEKPITIRVHETQIFMNESQVESPEKLAYYLDQTDSDVWITVQDEYAVAKVYKKVIEQIEERGFSYEETVLE